VTLRLPDFCLVLMVGPAGSGKSTFAARHFLPTEVLSSDEFRARICDDPTEQAVSADAFHLLHQLAGRRLAWRRLTVVDATNLKSQGRRDLVRLAARHQAASVAVVLDLPTDLVRARNQARARQVPDPVLARQTSDFHAELSALEREGFQAIHRIRDPQALQDLQIERVPLAVDRRGEAGPFDLIGDVHGCFEELRELLEGLGYRVDAGSLRVQPPAGRQALFLGDLVDRGPAVVPVLRLVMGMVEAGQAWCLPGNHDDRLLRHLRGNQVQVQHGLAQTLEQLQGEDEAFTARLTTFLEGLPSHLVLDGGALVAAHAGLRQDLQNRDSKRVRAFCLYGDPTGELDADGLPERRDWARDYSGQAAVVHGHTPVERLEWRRNTLNLDTGCVFGGALSALRWPERTLHSIPAHRAWCEPQRAAVTSPVTARVQDPWEGLGP